MGFFEGSVLLPHPVTWMDKVIVECVDALCWWEEERPLCDRTRRVLPESNRAFRT